MTEAKKYYGTKLVEAWPDGFGQEQGYALRYGDGYTSWSPKEAFEAAYQPLNALSFGHALEAVKAGKRVKRTIPEWDTWSLKKEGSELLLLFDDSDEIEVFQPEGYELFANDWMVIE